jgi:hypothetical protein
VPHVSYNKIFALLAVFSQEKFHSHGNHQHYRLCIKNTQPTFNRKGMLWKRAGGRGLTDYDYGSVVVGLGLRWMFFGAWLYLDLTLSLSCDPTACNDDRMTVYTCGGGVSENEIRREEGTSQDYTKS